MFCVLCEFFCVWRHMITVSHLVLSMLIPAINFSDLSMAVKTLKINIPKFFFSKIRCYPWWISNILTQIQRLYLATKLDLQYKGLWVVAPRHINQVWLLPRDIGALHVSLIQYGIMVFVLPYNSIYHRCRRRNDHPMLLTLTLWYLSIRILSYAKMA